MTNMSSIFDSIVTPGASLDTLGYSGASVPNSDATRAGAAVPPGKYITPPVAGPTWAPVQAPPVSPAAVATITEASTHASPVVAGSTGLVASLEPDQFARLVKGAASGTVLRMPVQITNQRRPGTSSPEMSQRYIFPSQGIVYVTLSRNGLDLGSRIRLVECLAVAYEGKPLGAAGGSI